MLQSRGELDLAQEALRAERMRQLGVQHLDRDEPLVLDVVREIDGGGAATANLALQDVSAARGSRAAWRESRARSVRRRGLLNYDIGAEHNQ